MSTGGGGLCPGEGLCPMEGLCPGEGLCQGKEWAVRILLECIIVHEITTNLRLYGVITLTVSGTGTWTGTGTRTMGNNRCWPPPYSGAV